MKNYFTIITSLTQDEFALFGKFLRSPLYNSSDRIRKYYGFLKKNYARLQKEGLTKEAIKKKFFPIRKLENETKAEGNTRKFISDFNKLYEEFLIYLECRKENGNRELHLARAYRKREIPLEFQSVIKELKKRFKNLKTKTSHDYSILKKIYEEERKYIHSTDFHTEDGVEQREADALDRYFISEKLGIFHKMFSKEYINPQTRYNWNFHDEISRFIESDLEEIKKSEPLIYFDYAILKLVINPSDKKLYYNLKEYVLEIESALPGNKLAEYISDLINYCSLQINKGNTEFRKEIQSLFEFLDEKELIVDDIINHYNFKLAVENSLSLRKFDWSEKFISRYSGYIEPDYRENITNLTYAKLYFFKGDYDSARHYQGFIGYKDFIHYIDAKLILACIEYETGNFEGVLSIFDSLNKYVRKHKDIPGSYKLFYHKFIISLGKLIKCRESISNGRKNKDTDFDLKQLLSGIQSDNKPFYGKKWLMEKITELQKNRK